MSAILGRKVGMTSIYDAKGKEIPCTVIEAGPCTIAQVKTKEKEGYHSYQFTFAEKKENRVSKPLLGHFKKAGVKPTYSVVEFRKEDVQADLNVGDVVKVDVFKEGEIVDVVGTSKGKGFAGVVKRHHFGGMSRTHGQSDRERAPGSMGGSSYPSRTFKGMRMAGRMGGDQVTVKNLLVVKVLADSNLLVVKGAIPGHKNSFVQVVSVKGK
ncbi:MAG: 50S ribosomal protein L3 [Chloroherpetonaceae bacterium]|nr:50S ribosomal protein L3 [Chloroherpetonaceae bacterium]